MDNESVAANNESVANNNQNAATTCCGNGSNEIGPTNKYKYGANNNESVANNNKSVAINKSPATTCCGNGSNEIGATNKYKYGANNNKSDTTCCCGCVSIETGTYVAAIVLFVDYILWAIFFFFGYPKIILFGLFNIGFACPCLLVVCGQQARNPWLFVPCLIAGVVDVIIRWHICFSFFKECKPFKFHGCTIIVVYIVVTILFHSWFYSIIVRGFLAAREVESRRFRPHF